MRCVFPKIGREIASCAKVVFVVEQEESAMTMDGHGATTMPFESVRSGPSTLHTPPSYRPSHSFGQRGQPISSTTSSPRSDQENQGDASRGVEGRSRVSESKSNVLQPSQPANGQSTPKRSDYKTIPPTPGGVYGPHFDVCACQTRGTQTEHA